MQEHQTAVRIDASLKPLHRIEAPMRPPMAASAGLVMDNWIGMPVAPPQIKAAPGQSTSVVLADDVEFPERSYSLSQGSVSKHIILIANTIHLTGRVTFSLQGRDSLTASLEERSGGHVTIIGRHFICERSGELHIQSYGGAGGHGGNINLVVEQADVQQRIDKVLDTILEVYRLGDNISGWTKLNIDEVSRKIDDPRARQKFDRLVSKKAKVDRELVEVIIHHQRAYLEKHPYDALVYRVLRGHEGEPIDIDEEIDGKFHTINHIKDVITLEPQHGPFAVSQWVIGLLEKLTVEINNAVLREDRGALIRLFRKVNALVQMDQYPIISRDFGAYQTLTDWLTVAKQQNLSALWMHPITAHPPGTVPRSLYVFSEANDLQSTLAPTEALVRRRLAGGRNVLGFLEFDPEREESVLTVEVELTVDPWLARLAATELRRTGEEYAGVFTNWVLHARDITDVGIKASTVEVVAPTVLRVSLTLDTQRASLVMLKLASSGGLPLQFDWEYRHDREITGEWFGPSLSLLRRTEPDLALTADGRVTNTGRTALTLEYLRLGEDHFHPLHPALTVVPGMTDTLPLPQGTNPSTVGIPPEAVVYSGIDPFNLADHFLILNGEQFLETFTVTNLLGPDESRGGMLEYVEVHLVYLGGAGEEASDVPAGPYRLAPRGVLGSETTVSFLKSRRGERRLRISGTAVYDSGSLQTLTPKTVSELTVKITEDMLPPLR